MTFRKLIAAPAISAALLFTAVPAAAQSAPRVGATVTDQQGGTVGTITAVEGEVIVLRTDRHEARLPANSFTVTADGVTFSLTRDELNSRIDQALAQAAQALQVGATVRDRDGAVVGTVEAIDEQWVTVRLDGQPARLPRAAVAARPDGLSISTTVAELRAQLAASAPQQAD